MGGLTLLLVSGSISHIFGVLEFCERKEGRGVGLLVGRRGYEVVARVQWMRLVGVLLLVL